MQAMLGVGDAPVRAWHRPLDSSLAHGRPMLESIRCYLERLLPLDGGRGGGHKCTAAAAATSRFRARQHPACLEAPSPASAFFAAAEAARGHAIVGAAYVTRGHPLRASKAPVQVQMLAHVGGSRFRQNAEHFVKSCQLSMSSPSGGTAPQTCLGALLSLQRRPL